MARSCDKGRTGPGVTMSSAFQSKTNQELTTLKASVAHKLQEDMIRMFEDEIHTDLIITNGKDSVPANRCLVQVRTKHLWQNSWITKKSSSDGCEVDCIEMPHFSRQQLEDFVRQLYSVSDGAFLMEEYLPYIIDHTHATQLQEPSVSDEQCKPDVGDFAQSVSISETALLKKTCSPTTLTVHSEETQNESVSSPDIESNIEAQVNHGSNVLKQTSAFLKSDEIASSSHDESVIREDGDHNKEKEVGSREQMVHKALEIGSCEDNEARPEVHEGGSALKQSTEKEGKGEEVAISGVDAAHGTQSDKGFLQASQGESGRCQSTVMGDSCLQMVGKDEDDGVSATELNIDPDGLSSEITKRIVNKASADSKNLDEHEENIHTNFPGDYITANGTKGRDTTVSALSDAVKASYALSVPYEPCSPLGRDLLQMHLQELHCDCCLSVDGIHFLAHRCILSARCEYFEAMFGGRWSESNMSKVTLEEVAPQAIEQLLLFLYGGVVDIAAPCDMTQLFIVADMYGISALKTVLTFHVKKDFCHFFHKPCQSCIAGACDALILCNKFNLDEFQSQCLKWMGKHFTRIWPTKTFSSLPEVLQQQSVDAVLAQMTPKNVVDTILHCDKLATSLPRIKWTENVLFTISQLMDSAIEFTSTNFLDVIQTSEFLEWAKAAAWRAGVLEGIFNTVIDSLPVDTACLVFQNLCKLMDYHSSLEESDADVVGLLESMLKRCEKYFRTHIHQVMRSTQWPLIPKETQNKILEHSSYVYLDTLSDAKAKPPLKISQRLSSSRRERGQSSMAAPPVIAPPTTGGASGTTRKRPNTGVGTSSSTTTSRDALDKGRSKTTQTLRNQEIQDRTVTASRPVERSIVQHSTQSTQGVKSATVSGAIAESDKGKKQTESSAQASIRLRNGKRPGLRPKSTSIISKSGQFSVAGRDPIQYKKSSSDETEVESQKGAEGGQPVEDLGSEKVPLRAEGDRGQRVSGDQRLKLLPRPKSVSESSTLPTQLDQLLQPTTKRLYSVTDLTESRERTHMAKPLRPRVSELRDQISPSKLPVKTSRQITNRSRPTSQIFDQESRLRSGARSLDNVSVGNAQSFDLLCPVKSESSVSELSDSALSRFEERIVSEAERCHIDNANTLSEAESVTNFMSFSAEAIDNSVGTSSLVDTNLNLLSTSGATSSSNIRGGISSLSSGDVQARLGSDSSNIDVVDDNSRIPQAAHMLGAASTGYVSEQTDQAANRMDQMVSETEIAGEIKIVAMSKSLTVGFTVPPEL